MGRGKLLAQGYGKEGRRCRGHGGEVVGEVECSGKGVLCVVYCRTWFQNYKYMCVTFALESRPGWNLDV